MDDECIDVGMDEFEIDSDATWVDTYGVSTCIGVVIIHNDRPSLVHSDNSNINPGFNEFCEAIDDLIRQEDRANIHPILTGGSLEDKTCASAVQNNRDYIKNRLARLGFGKPQEIWVPSGKRAQNIKIDTSEKTVTIETDSYSDSEPSQKTVIPF